MTMGQRSFAYMGIQMGLTYIRDELEGGRISRHANEELELGVRGP